MSSSSWWSRKIGEPAAPPPAYPPPPPAYQQPVQQQPVQPQQQSAEPLTVENVFDRAMGWTGGDAARTESGRCPSCGSDLYFSRTNTNAVFTDRGAAKVPARCYACGYTEGRPMQGIPT